jgi:penicillin-binding protein 1C
MRPTLSKKALRRLAITATAAAAFVALAWGGLEWADRAFPPPIASAFPVSPEVVDRDGRLLRAFATPEGRWRLAANLDDVDQQFVKMLIAYEDKRYFDHEGVDFVALMRAAVQFAGNGRIISGGSTLSMQLARLMEPRESRSFGFKVKQILRAIQIERRMTKREILEAYLTLAPYGGNLEGIRAASLAYFGKEPSRLTLSESALLVALPQLPERRRPDRNPAGAHAARDRVLGRMVTSGLIDQSEADRAAAEEFAAVRRPLPALAPHVASAALKNAPLERVHQLTISRRVQEGLETVAREAAKKLGPKLSVAMVMADAQTGEILGEVGSSDFFDASRSGWIDMTRTVRSPGSTLKPFIYGLAMEEGLVAQETIIEDRPTDFGGYRPRNFDMNYQGDVSIRQALQLSLNVPAVRLLDAVGPARLAARFRQVGATLDLPRDEPPGLAIGLGGVGITLHDLVQLYTGLSNGGQVKPLHDGAEPANAVPGTGGAVLDEQAAWQIADILSGVRPPEGAPARGIAYKTGTSYGYRDAWSIGFDGRYVLGVWIGRPDASATAGLSGYISAAPVLFEGFAKSGLAAVPLRPAPAGAYRPKREELPVTMARFTSGEELVASGPTEPAPQIVFPPQGARVDLGVASGNASALVMKIQGGRAPFRWLANGKPLATVERRRVASWVPDGAGTSTLTVIDAAGRAASVSVFVE